MQESQSTSEESTYHYNELPSQTAKDRARSNYIERWIYDDWHNYIIEDAKEGGRVRGFEIESVLYSGFWSQGDGASWVGDVKIADFINYYMPEPATIGRDAWLWLIQDGWVHDRVSIYRGASNYFHEMTMQVGNVEVYDHGTESVLDCKCILQNAPIETVWNLITSDPDCPIKSNSELEELILEKARDYAQMVYKHLQDGYEHETSDENISEVYDANNILFNEEGEAV